MCVFADSQTTWEKTANAPAFKTGCMGCWGILHKKRHPQTDESAGVEKKHIFNCRMVFQNGQTGDFFFGGVLKNILTGNFCFVKKSGYGRNRIHRRTSLLFALVHGNRSFLKRETKGRKTIFYGYTRQLHPQQRSFNESQGNHET